MFQAVAKKSGLFGKNLPLPKCHFSAVTFPVFALLLSVPSRLAQPSRRSLVVRILWALDFFGPVRRTLQTNWEAVELQGLGRRLLREAKGGKGRKT